jgi:hypothetical protein
MTKEMMLMLIRHSGDVVVPLYLGSGGGEQVNVHVVPVIMSSERAERRRNMGGMNSEGVWRRHIGRARGRCRC